MPNLLIMTRAAAAAYLPAESDALLSLYDAFLEPLSPQPGWAEVMQLGFHDGPETQVALPIFSGAHAKSILLFAARNKDARTIVVACPEAGARSAAATKYLAEKYAWPMYHAGQEVYSAELACYDKHIYRFLYLADRQLVKEARFAPVNQL